jgi:hypothetical protein
MPLLSTNSVHQIVPAANRASFWLDPETAKISIEKILHIVEAAQTGEKVKQ